MVEQTIQEKIKQRRRQMLVHSYLYYERDVNIISDSKWSKWAMELVELQEKHPKEARQVEFFEDFKDWDGNSGAGLKFPEDIKSVAEKLYEFATRPKEEIVKKVPVKIASVKKTATRKLF